jgi:glycosyltransferase involved in cell wall biosynthesis
MSTESRPIRVLALSPIPEEGAGCRFRVSQYIPYLESHGFEVTFSSLFTPEFFRRVYQRGNHVRKAAAFVGLSLRRLQSLSSVNAYDLLLVYREIFPVGPAIVERLLALPGRPPIVFDFDDAMFLPSVSDANRLIAALKFPGKLATIVRVSDHVLAGNDYLAAYARRFNDAVTMIPTCVDTTKFVPRSDGGSAVGQLPVVGWIGSPTTGTYIRGLSRVLQRVHAQHPFILRISGAGEPIVVDGVPTEEIPWTLDREIELFNTCDVGVYPLEDDEWAKGKCGFKAIELMACGVPVVASAVGVNRTLVDDGSNGFLASTEDEWVDKLLRLLTDAALRRRFAAAGRRTVEAGYSLHVNAPRLAATLREVVDRSRLRHASAQPASAHRTGR